MSRYKSAILLLLQIAIGSLIFAIIWIRTPSLWIITLPDGVWRLLQDGFNASCCEGIADVEFVGGLILGAFFSIVIIVMLRIAKRLMARVQQTHKGTPENAHR